MQMTRFPDCIVEDGQVSQACKVVYKIVAPGILLYYVRKDIARVN